MILRTRFSIFFLSFAVIGLEFALMRVLSLGFWYYFASMIIGVALLGFGSSGTILTIFQSRVAPYRRFWLCFLAFAACLSVFFSSWAVQYIPLDIHYLAWNPGSEWFHILEIEIVMLLPFFLSGGFLGLMLMDRSEWIHGHYASNLIGSGAGALLSILLLHYISTSMLLVLLGLLFYSAGLVLTDWRDKRSASGSIAVGILCLTTICFFPPEIMISPYKKLALERSKPDTDVIYTAEGPLGRIDVIQGPSIHDAPPGMSLENRYPLPERSLVIVDGDQTHILYNYETSEDWRFLDFTTSALPFALDKPSRVLIIGPGGGSVVALAKMHDCKEIIALADNKQMVKLIQGSLADKGGKIFGIQNVHMYFKTPRGYLRDSSNNYGLILIPLLDPSGEAGPKGIQENYLYTIQSFQTMINHLEDDGMLCVTVHGKTPPRDGLRIFNIGIESLMQEGFSPSERLVLIRSWETVTMLLKKDPLTDTQLRKIREFCKNRSFDLCYLADISAHEANLFHVLPSPFYYEGSQRLLGPERDSYIQKYMFALEAPTDDRPFFNNFLRWRYLPELKKQLRGSMPAFLELGSLLMAASFIQVVVLAGLFIFFPLFPVIPVVIKAQKKGNILFYFFLLGLGFMLLEMGFLQKMILYLAHPIYSASAVIASFLVFAGAGSILSRFWSRIHFAVRVASSIVVIISLFYLFLLDEWLALTQYWPLAPRFFIATLTISPLALAMGHLFPMGLRIVSERIPGLVPWSWAVNGFASVLATVSAPLLAMSIGFSGLVLAALICYMFAGLLFPLLPDEMRK